MGSTESRSAAEDIPGRLKAEYKTIQSLLTENEQQVLNEAFEAITCVTLSDSLRNTSERSFKDFNFEKLKKFLDSKLPDVIVQRLFNQMWLHQGALKKPDDAKVSTEAFIVTLGKLLKGTVQEQSHIVFYLATDNDASQGISKEDIATLVSDLLTSYEKLIKETGQMRGWQISATEEQNNRFVDYIIQEIVEISQSRTKESSMLTEEDIYSWLGNTAMFQQLLQHVLNLCFSQAKAEELPERSDSKTDLSLSTRTSLLPVCQDMSWNKISSLLDVPSLVLLNRHLPHQLHVQWRFLYSSAVHGASFATFLSHVKRKGPILLVVRDTGGHLFGGFLSEGLDLGPAFTVATRSFLFQLSPKLGVFESSGQNDHHVYLNIDQQTLPNGLAMGGQLHYFGFWLSQDFGKGHSKATPKCTTYDSPQLSATEEFEVDILEAWALGPPPRTPPSVDSEDDEAKTSILDKDPEAQAILELAGKERKSEGLRDEDPTADIPEVHSLPAL